MTFTNTAQASGRIAQLLDAQPKAVDLLLWEFGEEQPQNDQERMLMVKRLVRDAGKPFVLGIHRLWEGLQTAEQAVLALPCAKCSAQTELAEVKQLEKPAHKDTEYRNYTGLLNPQTSDAATNHELLRYLLSKAEQEPENRDLDRDIRILWDQIRKKKMVDRPIIVNQSKGNSLPMFFYSDVLVLLGLTLVVGLVLGGVAKSLSHGK